MPEPQGTTNPEGNPSNANPQNPPEPKTPEPKNPDDGNDGDGSGEGDLNKALNAERYKTREEKRLRKEAEERLAEYERKEKEREDANLRRKGDFDKLEEQLKAENEKLKSEVKDLTKFKTDYEETATARIEEMKQKVPEDSRDLLSQTLEGKTLQEQEALLPKLVEKFGVPTNINNPADGSTPPSSEKQKKIQELETAIAKAKEEGKAKDHIRLSGELQKLKQQDK